MAKTSKKKRKAVKLDPQLEKALQAVKDKFVDSSGNMDILVMLAAVRSLLGEEKFLAFEERLIEHYQPEGVVETFQATWRMSKTQTILAGLGGIAAVVAICEIGGRVFDVPSIKFATKLANWVID